MVNNRFFIIKADASEIVECTNEVLTHSVNYGNVTNLGNGFTDNPAPTMEMSLKNTNQKLYSPHFEANKVKFDESYILTGNGGKVYGSPYEYTLLAVSFEVDYQCNFINGNIVFDKNVPAGVQIEVYISYIDTTEKNPLNHTTGNVYAPLIQEGNVCYKVQESFDLDTKTLFLRGNGTNTIDSLESNIYQYTLATAYKLSNETELFDIYNLDLDTFYKYKEYYGDKTSTTVVTIESESGGIFTFDRNIELNEYVEILVTVKKNIEEIVKFYGKITNQVNSQIEVCNFQCQDLSYDLKSVKIDPSKFRKYFTEKDELDNLYTIEEKLTQVQVTNNSITTTYNNLISCATVGERFFLYDGENFIECETTGFSFAGQSLHLTYEDELFNVYNEDLVNIYYDTTKVYTLTYTVVDPTESTPDGLYSLYTKYTPSLTFERFIQNCLDDTNTNYNLFVKNFSDQAIIPKVKDLQYNSLWTFFQELSSKLPFILGFEYTDSTETYYNADGEAVQGTDSYELVFKAIPLVVDTPKYFISEKEIISDADFTGDGTQIVNSYSIKYNSAETNEIEVFLKDDFFLSVHQVTIATERNIIITDELLNVGEWIRVNKEYRQVSEVIDSQTYRVSLSFTDTFTGNLYTEGESTQKYGLRQAYIELDNTSEIDTEEQANIFGQVLINQSLDIYSTIRFKVETRLFSNIKNFDTVRMNTPKFNLLNKDMFVLSLQEDDNYTTFTTSEIMEIGKYKYYNMRTEEGNNKVNTTDDINTNDIFPPVNKLKADSPAVDNANGYKVYTRVSWNKLIGHNVTSYELQYKKESEDWTQAEVVTLTENSIKIPLTEQSIYNIRVKARGKEQLDGKWANTSINASVVFKNNPIRDGVWYIELDDLNDVDSYFFLLDEYNLYNNNYSEIKIIPGGIADINLNNLLEKIELKNNNFLKKINFNNFEGYYYLDNDLDIRKFSIVTSNNNAKWKITEINEFTRGRIYDSNTIDPSAKFQGEFSNIEIFIDFVVEPQNINLSLIKFYLYTSDVWVNPSRKIENCKIKILNLPASSPFVVLLEDCEYIKSLEIDLNQEQGLGGFVISNCKNIYDLTINNSPNNSIAGKGWSGLENCSNVNNVQLKGYYFNSFSFCNKMSKNKKGLDAIFVSVNGQYYDCYASESNNSTYLIASNGSDTANGGFNT